MQLDYSKALIVKNSIDVIRMSCMRRPVSRADLHPYIDEEVIFDPPLPHPSEHRFRNEVYKRTNTGIGNTRAPVVIDGTVTGGIAHSVFFETRDGWIVFD